MSPDTDWKYCVCRGPWVLKNHKQWAKMNAECWVMDKNTANTLAKEYEGEATPVMLVFKNEKARLNDPETKGYMILPTDVKLVRDQTKDWFGDKNKKHPLQVALEECEAMPVEDDDDIKDDEPEIKLSSCCQAIATPWAIDNITCFYCAKCNEELSLCCYAPMITGGYGHKPRCTKCQKECEYVLTAIDAETER